MTKAFYRSALLSATICASASQLHAQTIRTGVDVSAEAEVTKNPYLDEANNNWVGAGSVEVRPWLVSETAKDRVQLEAFARGRAFTSGFNFEDTFGGSVSASHRASPRTSYYGQANVISTSARSNFTRFSRGGFGYDPLAPIDPAAPTPIDPVTGLGPPILPPLDDITIIGLQGRSTTLSISAGMAQQLDTRSSLNLNIDHNRLWVSGNQLSGYESVSVAANYSRTVSARTSVGLAVNAGQTRYENGFPNTNTLGAFVNAQHQLARGWSLGWSAGVSHSQSPAEGVFPEISQTGLAGNVNLCRAQSRTRLCLGVSRSQQPSTLGQTRTSDSVDFTFREQLSARDRIDLNANYARSSAPNEIATPLDEIEIASVGATLTRTLNPRLDGYVFGRGSRIYGRPLASDPELAFGIGIRVRLGDRR